MARAELLGCFGLTEPDHGSDPGSDEEPGAPGRRRLALTGNKTWITHAPIADLMIVWAKDDETADRRLHPRARHEGPEHLEDRRQVLGAGLAHRRDPHGRGVRARVAEAARRARPGRPLRLPEQRALRHLLGRDGRGRVLLARGAPVHDGPHPVRPPAGRQPAGAEEAGRHADRDRARPAGLPAPEPPARRGQASPRWCRCSSATAPARRWRSPALARDMHGGNGIADDLPRDPPPDEPRDRQHARRHARHPRAGAGPRETGISAFN
jgi:hypothetical protein